jgi:hypothetical protein
MTPITQREPLLVGHLTLDTTGPRLKRRIAISGLVLGHPVGSQEASVDPEASIVLQRTLTRPQERDPRRRIAGTGRMMYTPITR